MTVETETVRRFRFRDEGVEVDGPESTEGPGLGDPGGVRIGHLSDLHFGKPVDGGAVPAIALEWLEAFRRAQVEVVVFSGDLVERPGDRVAMLRMRELFDHVGLPSVFVPGNHDVAEPGCDGAFYELFGAYPRVERHAGLDFILADSIGGLPVAERSPFDRLEALRGGSFPRGRIGSSQLDEASNLLAPESRGARVLVTHHHLAAESAILDNPPESGAPDALMIPALDAETTLDWASDHGVRLVFHGHKHAFWPPYVRRDGVVILNSGSSARGKPDRRARIVDLQSDGSELAVWRLRHDL